jgi:hypothetical protein
LNWPIYVIGYPTVGGKANLWKYCVPNTTYVKWEFVERKCDDHDKFTRNCSSNDEL